MVYETITFEVKDGTAYLTLNRPEVKNAINLKMLEELESALEYIRNEELIKLLHITGSENSFCAGADTTEFLSMSAEENQDFLQRFSKIVMAIEDIPVPVIGVINGYAFGGGAEIAAACDFRVVSKRASFRFPGVSYGLVVGTRNLPLIVGVPKAKELLFRSCIITAEEAFRIGFADHLIENEELYSFSAQIINEITNNSITAIKKVKEAINQGIGSTYDRRREIEQQTNEIIVHRTDYRTTFSTFVEKRKKVRQH